MLPHRLQSVACRQQKKDEKTWHSRDFYYDYCRGFLSKLTVWRQYCRIWCKQRRWLTVCFGRRMPWKTLFKRGERKYLKCENVLMVKVVLWIRKTYIFVMNLEICANWNCKKKIHLLEISRKTSQYCEKAPSEGASAFWSLGSESMRYKQGTVM